MHGKNRRTQIEQRSSTATEALRKKGMSYRDIAEIVSVNYDTVGRWYRDYKKYGAQGIKIKQRDRKQGEQRTLTPDQEKRIQKAIVDNDPDQLKLPFALWTRIAVITNQVKVRFMIYNKTMNA